MVKISSKIILSCRFLFGISNSISLMAIGLFRLSVSSWLSFGICNFGELGPFLLKYQIYECKVVCSIPYYPFNGYWICSDIPFHDLHHLFLLFLGLSRGVFALLTFLRHQFLICWFPVFIFLVSLLSALYCFILFA